MIDLDGKSDYSKAIFLKNEKLEEIRVFPNPASSYVLLENLDGKALNIRILDALGRDIIVQQKSSELSIRISMAGVSFGTYFMQIQSEKGMIFKKVLVGK